MEVANMKAIKAAVTVFVVTLLVATGAAFIFGGMSAVTFAGFSSVLFGVEVMAIAAMSAVSTLVGGLLSRDVDGVSQNFGTKIASRTPTAPRPIIYGECRVGGTITHIETAGTDNHKLRMVICLAGHEVESLEKVFINDLEVTSASSGGFQVVTNSKYVNTDNDNSYASGRLVRFKFLDGSQTSADSTVIANSSLGSNDKFTGIAYVFIEMIFDSEAFGGGFPSLAFVVKGKKVYDPRDSGQSATDSSTWEWSDNPALHVRDYLQDTVYGMKALPAEINDTTNLGGFSACANTCDSGNTVATSTNNGAVNNSTSVTLNLVNTNGLIAQGMTVTGTGISGTVKVASRRGIHLTLDTAVTIANGVTLSFAQVNYTSNGFTDMAATGEGVLSGLLSSMAGKLSYVDGKFLCFAGASVTPEMTITDDNLLAPIQVQTANGKGEAYNAVKAIFVNSLTKYVATDTPTYTDSTLLANDTPSGESSANYRKTLEIQLPFTTSKAMAERLQKQALLHHRQEVAISVVVNIGFMQVQPFDHVFLTNERLGFTQKRFEVLGQTLEVIDGSDDSGPVLGTRLDLKEIDPAVYNFATSDYTNIGDEDEASDTGDRSVTAPTGLALTQRTELEGATVKADIEVSWTNNGDDLVMGTEIAYKLSTDANYEGHIVVGKGETKGLIPNVVVGKTYNVKVRHLAQTNVYSDYTSAVNLQISDPTSIPAPTGLTATGNPLGISVEWTNSNTTAFRAAKVYRKTSNVAPTNDSSLVATIAGEPNKKSFIHQGKFDGLTAGTTYYFWVRGVTFTGVESSLAGSVNASFTDLDKDDVGLPNVTNDTQVKSDLSNFSVESDLFEITSSELRGKNPIKNTQITLAKDGSGNLSLSNAGSGNVSFNKGDVGLGNLINAEQVKLDLSNAPNAIKNAEIVDADIIGSGKVFGAGNKPNKTVLNGNNLEVDGTSQGAVKNSGISLNLSGQSLSLTGGGGSAQSFDKGSVGLSDLDSLESGTGTKLSGIEANATVGAQAGTNLKDSGGSSLGDEDVRNSDLSVDFTGNTTFRIKKGSTVIDTQAFNKGNVGLSDLDSLESGTGTKLSGIEAGATVGAKAGTNLKDSSNNSLSDADVRNSDLVIAKSGQQIQLKKGSTAIDSVSIDKSTVGLSDLDSLESGTGTKLSGIEAGATVGAVAGTNLKDSSNNNLTDDDVKNDSLQIDTSGTSVRIKKGSSVINTTTLDKGSVGLSNLASLDSAQNTKLTGIEANATVGAKLNDNLLDESGNDLADTDVVTSQGTSNDTNNVNSVAKADITGSITGTQTNVASVIQNLAAGSQAINASALNAGEINTSLIKIDELFLPTTGTDASGTLVLFGSSMTQVSLGDIGTGAGFYMGTISVEIDDANNDDIRGASLHIDLKSGFSTVYTKYWPIGHKEGNRYYDHGDQFGDSGDLPVMHLEFGYFHNANTTLNLFVNGDSNDNGTHCRIKARVVKFGAETVAFNTSSFTSAVTGATASSTQDSGTITVSGFTTAKQVNLSGHSSALVSVNGGTFVNAASVGTITANQTLELRLTASSTAGTTRSCTVEVGGTSATFTVTTTGTYTPQYSGGGGSGGAGGGFETQTQLN